MKAFESSTHAIFHYIIMVKDNTKNLKSRHHSYGLLSTRNGENLASASPRAVKDHINGNQSGIKNRAYNIRHGITSGVENIRLCGLK